ncbi:hypothetical protein M422DRAFT_155675, partial [Sphaerobolus stellatus SS14]
KYPLATCAYLLSLLPKSPGLGYDIACSFGRTLARSSLSPKAKERKIKLVVPAFHGYAHNHPCQLSYHIQMTEGFGLEDAETCERVFSGSNKVARLTRHCTPFHRHQFIDMYFQQWDFAKYESLGMFLHQNYIQALEILEEMPAEINMLTGGRMIADAHYVKWLDEERLYLESKQKEPELETFKIDYVELLQKYEAR